MVSFSDTNFTFSVSGKVSGKVFTRFSGKIYWKEFVWNQLEIILSSPVALLFVLMMADQEDKEGSFSVSSSATSAVQFS